MHRRALLVAFGLVLAASAPGARVSHAQDAPVQDAPAQAAPAQRPAEIRTGTCASLGQVVAPLSALTVPEGQAQGQAGATPVEQSETVVPLLLTDLLATGHIVVVQQSPEASGTPVACGEIGGALGGDGTLAVGMNPIEGSKLGGVAYFAPTRQEDGTIVTVLLVDERANRPARDGGEGGDGSGAVGMAGEDGAISIGTGTVDGANGANGAIGADGKPGKDGADGADGADGQPGQDGQDGANGRAGRGGEGGQGGEGGAGGTGGAGGNGGDGGNGGAANG